jgi:hypothetical protein
MHFASKYVFLDHDDEIPPNQLQSTPQPQQHQHPQENKPRQQSLFGSDPSK